MKLTRVEPADDVCRLNCQGSITSDDVEGKDPLAGVLGEAGYAARVLLGLEDVNYIDSAGIGWLLRSHHRFRQAGGRLVIHSVPPRVDNVFQMLRMPAVLNLARDERAARAAAQEGTS
jgi:anti-anti-sigma factor